MNDNTYISCFAPNLNISVSAYIAELIITNKLNDRIKRKTKNAIDFPRCAFWRKEMLDKHPQFRQLAIDFQTEIAYTRKLLNCFLPIVIIQYVKKYHCITFTYKTLAEQRQMIFDLFKNQNDIIKQQKTMETQRQKHEKLTKKVNTRKSMTTKLTNILND